MGGLSPHKFAPMPGVHQSINKDGLKRHSYRRNALNRLLCLSMAGRFAPVLSGRG